MQCTKDKTDLILIASVMFIVNLKGHDFSAKIKQIFKLELSVTLSRTSSVKVAKYTLFHNIRFLNRVKRTNIIHFNKALTIKLEIFDIQKIKYDLLC